MPDTDHPAVLAHRCDWQGRGVLVLHNLGPEPVEVGVALAGFGYRWLRPPG